MAAITFDERKTNERPGVRAQHRHARFSAYKARQVLDLIRGESVAEARIILEFSDRSAAQTIAKVLDSAIANAANNNDIPPEELFVAACFADEGPTLKRWRPRARGRATRIRKRTCHITVIVGRYSPEELDRKIARLAGRGRTSPDAATARARRVARSRAAEESSADDAALEDAANEVVEEAFAETALDVGAASETGSEETVVDGADAEVDSAEEGATAEETAEGEADTGADGETATETDETDTDETDTDETGTDETGKKDD
jgi:large subunit ribosomal protein L22